MTLPRKKILKSSVYMTQQSSIYSYHVNKQDLGKLGMFIYEK